ncbi:putative FRE family ferric-chelate reductase [Aureobasidium sp. EXF-8845]|nr:putative FRE family ferric-chelate reductase [Aureobasidium sp. EXF-8845]
MSLLLLFSISWLRVKFYEIFLALHIVLSVVTLVGCFFKESDVVRLDIKSGSFLTKPAAGQFYYLYQPTTWQGYENHPFTLGTWSLGHSTSDEAGSSLLQQIGTQHDLDQIESSSRHTMGLQTLTFWIRPYDGWTKRLRDECLRSPTQTTTPTILLEGPYGHHRSTSSFDSMLLIAGGTGVASAVPYILEHMALSEAGKTDTTHVHLLWTVRQASFIQEVFTRELRTALQRDDFSADLFFTRQSEGPKHAEEAFEREDDESFEMPELQYGRPDIAAAISKAATRAEMTGTKVAVLVCGPPAMADEARSAVHRALKRGCHSVEYFEESFGW